MLVSWPIEENLHPMKLTNIAPEDEVKVVVDLEEDEVEEEVKGKHPKLAEIQLVLRQSKQYGKRQHVFQLWSFHLLNISYELL